MANGKTLIAGALALAMSCGLAIGVAKMAIAGGVGGAAVGAVIGGVVGGFVGDRIADPESRGPDRDRDGISDRQDNCPDTPNRTQQDSDGNARGDACDP